MQEEIISFQTAKLAKEKGFNEPTEISIDEYGSIQKHVLTTNSQWNDATMEGELTRLHSAPTQSLLQRWLREVHGIHIDIRMIEDEEDYEKITWAFQVVTKNLFGDVEYGDFNSYEEALEVGLQEALKLIKTSHLE